MSIQRPFRFGIEANWPSRFGIGANWSRPSYPEWINLVRRAEDLGYATLHVQDHFSRSMGPLTSLTGAAAATKSIRLGSFVFANDFRHPVVLAQEAATLDVISGGRFEFGIGTGFSATDYKYLGIQPDPPGVRVDRLVEAIKIVKGFFSGESFSFDGRYYHADGLVGWPTPVQQPMPPLMIGGGSRRVLSLAAKEADVVSINIRTTPEGNLDFRSITAEAVSEKVRWIREASGDRLDKIELNVLVLAVAITDQPRAAAEQLLQIMGVPTSVLSPDEALASPSLLIGPVSKLVEDLLERRERYGLSYVSAFGSTMEDLAPVVARLSGR
jgi:probable F420-dependent oxidoreductase